MTRQLMKIVFRGGLVVASARLTLAVLYLYALAGIFRGAEAAAGPILALVFVTVYGGVLWDWREPLLVVFAPDATLWPPATEPSVLGRLGIAACRHAALWFFLMLLLYGIVQHPGLLVPLPLLASLAQQLGRAVWRRFVTSGCGAPGHRTRPAAALGRGLFRDSTTKEGG